jgi:hypothetical protein
MLLSMLYQGVDNPEYNTDAEEHRKADRPLQDTDATECNL